MPTNSRTFARFICRSLVLGSIGIAHAGAVANSQQPFRLPPDTVIVAMMQAMRVIDAPAMAPLINALLSDTAAHMRMVPRRPATAADSLRASDIVTRTRAALARYADISVAEREGYVKFLPWLDDQIVFHYNSMRNVVASSMEFDVAKPASLLYRKEADGRMRLIGAMYTAPARSTPDQLDARLPLAFAHWHQHVSLCGPMVRDVKTMPPITAKELARWLAIEDRETCTAAGGIFIPELFGWMAHVNAFDGDSGTAIWGHDGGNQMHMHARPPM